LPVGFALQRAVPVGRARVAIVREHHAVAHENLIVDDHSLADEGVRRYLAAGPDDRFLLDLDERADLRLVADCTSVEIDERGLDDAHTLPEANGIRNGHAAPLVEAQRVGSCADIPQPRQDVRYMMQHGARSAPCCKRTLTSADWQFDGDVTARKAAVSTLDTGVSLPGGLARVWCNEAVRRASVARGKARGRRSRARAASVETAGQRDVSVRAIAEDDVRDAVALRADVPHAVPEDAQIGLAVAVPIEQRGNVLRHAAENGDHVYGPVPVGIDVPDAVAI